MDNQAGPAPQGPSKSRRNGETVQLVREERRRAQLGRPRSEGFHGGTKRGVDKAPNSAPTGVSAGSSQAGPFSAFLGMFQRSQTSKPAVVSQEQQPSEGPSQNAISAFSKTMVRNEDSDLKESPSSGDGTPLSSTGGTTELLDENTGSPERTTAPSTINKHVLEVSNTRPAFYPISGIQTSKSNSLSENWLSDAASTPNAVSAMPIRVGDANRNPKEPSPQSQGALIPLTENTPEQYAGDTGSFEQITALDRRDTKADGVEHRLEPSIQLHPGDSQEKILEARKMPSLDTLAVIPIDNGEQEPLHGNEDVFGGIRISSRPPVEPGDVARFAKLLRQTRKLTDEVLFARTQWRHANQKLEHCRQFLQKSTSEFMSALAIQGSLAERNRSPRPQNRRHWTREAVRQMDGLSDLDRQSIASPPIIDSGVASGESGSHEGAVATESRSLNIQKLSKQYLSDYDALLAQEDYMKSLMDDLSNQEFRLAQKEEEISKRMRASNFAAELRTEMLTAELAQSDSESQMRSVTDNMPPLVGEYFDRRGDIGIFQERLQELDFNHDEGRLERDFLRERGDDHLVEVSDEEFESNYRFRRKQIGDDLEWAEHEAARLLKLCEEEGLDTNAHRGSVPSMYSTSAALQSPQLTSDIMPAVPQVVELRHTNPLPAGVQVNSTRRIDSWLRNVPQDASEPSRTTSVNEPESPAPENSVLQNTTEQSWLPLIPGP